MLKSSSILVSHTIEFIVDFFSSALIGVFLGFVFGVGCALAVMYSIYMGGYRAAVRDAQLPSPPKRLLDARARKLPPLNHPSNPNLQPPV
jgi:hypothetical protein